MRVTTLLGASTVAVACVGQRAAMVPTTVRAASTAAAVVPPTAVPASTAKATCYYEAPMLAEKAIGNETIERLTNEPWVNANVFSESPHAGA